MQGSVASPPGSLLALSPEILSQIFAYLDPVDVARAGQVCRKLARLIDPRSNGVLWRTLFHTLFDPLDLSDGLAGDAESLQGASTGPNGRSGSALYAFLVQQRCNVRGLIHCADTSQKIANRSLVLHTLCDILDSAASSGTRISRNAIFLDSLLCSSATSVKDWLTPEANDPRPYSEAQLERPRRRQRTPQQFPAAHEDVVQQAENPPNGVHVANETSESLEDDASATLCTEVQLTTDLGEGFHADADSDEISPSSEPLSPTLSDHLLKGKAEVRPLPNAADTSDASSEQADSSSSAGSKAVESGLQALTELWAAKDDYPTLILDEYSSRPAHAHPDQASSEPSQSSDFPKRNKMKKTDTADAGLCVASSRGSLQVADDGAPATQMLSNASTTKRDDKTQDSGARQRGVLTRSAVSSSSDDSASSVLALSPAYAATTTPKSDYKRPSRKRRRGPSDAVKSLPMLINADPELKALSCKLHAAGTNFREVDWTSYASACRYREIVYRSSTWTASNMYGPFRRTGGDADSWEVDWVLLDAIVRVLAAGVKSAWHQWGTQEEMLSLPYGFEKAVFWKQPGPGRDWANVEGEWSYIYSFIDYSDYFAFNFAAGAQQQAISTLDGISEAVGGMNVLTFRLASDEELEEAGLAATQEDDEDDPFPPLRFVGNAFGPAGSTHTGLVRRLPNGYRHWTFTIRYAGEDRWQTQGAEVGERGIYGVWGDVRHDALSPAGPVWYFRNW